MHSSFVSASFKIRVFCNLQICLFFTDSKYIEYRDNEMIQNNQILFKTDGMFSENFSVNNMNKASME